MHICYVSFSLSASLRKTVPARSKGGVLYLTGRRLKAFLMGTMAFFSLSGVGSDRVGGFQTESFLTFFTCCFFFCLFTVQAKNKSFLKSSASCCTMSRCVLYSCDENSFSLKNVAPKNWSFFSSLEKSDKNGSVQRNKFLVGKREGGRRKIAFMCSRFQKQGCLSVCHTEVEKT